jgi:hypothetical protein
MTGTPGGRSSAIWDSLFIGHWPIDSVDKLQVWFEKIKGSACLGLKNASIN